jgi:conjugal transfer pilus assembly protein TraK
MSYTLSCIGIGVGSALVTRWCDLFLRNLGYALILISVFFLVTPAHADQTLMVADNSTVNCKASSKDLTRISLVGDEFASVSKISTGSELDDFSVVNEPLRGDIYLSIPDGFARKSLSFFATTKKGYVYKFACGVEGDEAQQVFLTNAALAQQKAADWEGQGDPEDLPVRLIQAMVSKSLVEGYQIRQPALVPVTRGAFKVQLISEYSGARLIGKSVRIENVSDKPLILAEAQIDPRGALAVAIEQPNLKPGQATMAYVVREGE